MPNLMQRAATWHAGKLQAAAGRTVTLQMDTGEITDLVGTVTQQVYEVADAEGFTTLLANYDWTFTRAELLLNSVEVEPKSGHRIVETLGSQEITYEIVKLPNRPAMEWLDTSGKLVVLHCLKIGVDG